MSSPLKIVTWILTMRQLDGVFPDAPAGWVQWALENIPNGPEGKGFMEKL